MKQTGLFEEPTVEEKKDALLDAIASTTKEAQRFELGLVMGAIMRFADTGEEFTSEHVRVRAERELGRKLEHPNMIGIGFHKLAQGRHIHRVGYQSSSTPSRHGAVVRVWRGRKR